MLDNYVLKCYKSEPLDDIAQGQRKDFTETELTADSMITVDDGRAMTIFTPKKKIIIKIQEDQEQIVTWYKGLKQAVQQLNASTLLILIMNTFSN